MTAEETKEIIPPAKNDMFAKPITINVIIVTIVNIKATITNNFKECENIS